MATSHTLRGPERSILSLALKAYMAKRWPDNGDRWTEIMKLYQAVENASVVMLVTSEAHDRSPTDQGAMSGD